MDDLPVSMRTAEMEGIYREAKQRDDLIPLDEEAPILQWKYWKLIYNRFPYDAVFAEHEMLVPLTPVRTRDQLSFGAVVELNTILNELANQYDIVFENLPRKRSIKALYHLHLCRYHNKRSDTGLI